VYITHDGGATWIDLAKITATVGVNGNPYGNYYFNLSVFASVTPYLTFGASPTASAPIPTARFGWWMSGLLIDPTNPDHLLYGTGATIFATNNVSAADRVFGCGLLMVLALRRAVWPIAFSSGQR
jgi:oligoxyloglucan reducing-end-specific cellobiohydrolase